MLRFARFVERRMYAPWRRTRTPVIVGASTSRSRLKRSTACRRKRGVWPAFARAARPPKPGPRGDVTSVPGDVERLFVGGRYSAGISDGPGPRALSAKTAHDSA